MAEVREFFYNTCHFTVVFPLHHSYILPLQKLTQCKVQKLVMIWDLSVDIQQQAIYMEDF